MNAESVDMWSRAKKSLHAAQSIVGEDPDSAASRAYYAAFHAVSAFFALNDKTFSRHSAVEAAVHRDLVKAGIWENSLGSDFSWLCALRSTGDYGGSLHVSEADAKSALEKSAKILAAIQIQAPSIFV